MFCTALVEDQFEVEVSLKPTAPKTKCLSSTIKRRKEYNELKPPKSKKAKKPVREMNFAKTLKHSGDMSSLFAAAGDFAELLEETGKTKGQGTSSAVYNKDKSSEKQMKWEEKRRSNSKNYTGKDKKFGGGAQKFGKKRERAKM